MDNHSINPPLLSIVIPTKDRYFYLRKLVETIRGFSSKDIEIVIQDNTGHNNEIIDFINNFDYPRLIYRHNAEPMSISNNSDLAILNSSGEYVCFIGDDDGVSANIIEFVKFLKENDIDSAICSETRYNWPDYKDDSIFNLSSTLSYKSYSFKTEKLNPQRELNKVIKNGFRNLGQMPRVYQGIVRRSVLNKLYSIAHTFFPGASPDMANAVALSFLVKNHYIINAPIIISGQSKYVGGGERLVSSLPHINDVPFLPKNISKIWNPKIPDLWCSDTIWPQTGIYSLRLMGKNRADIDYDKILAYFFFNHRSYKKEYGYLITNRFRVKYLMMLHLFMKAYRYVFNRLTYIFSFKHVILDSMLVRDINDISEAISFCSKKSFTCLHK